MWPYKNVSRDEFEKRKDYVDVILRESGCVALTVNLPYEQKTTTHGLDFKETWFSGRPLYRCQNGYVRIDEVLFGDKPCIVLELAETMEDVLKNRMEDADPFPYDLPDEEIGREVKCSLGIESYPDKKDTPGQ